MMDVCAGSYSWLQLSSCFHGVKKELHVAINIIAQNFKKLKSRKYVNSKPFVAQ